MEWAAKQTMEHSGWPTGRKNPRQYRIILSADTASEVRQMPSQKRR